MSSNAPAGSLSNTDRERTETLARAYKTKGFQAIDNEDWTAAITAFLHFIPYQDKLTTTSSAECAEGFEGLGTAALGESKYSEAEEAFKEVLRVREDNSHGGLELGDRLDVVHPREKMAKVREHQGRLLDARDLRLRGEKDGRMRCAASKCARNTVPYAELSQVANAFSTALLLARYAGCNIRYM
ncbi:hypothetical protein FA15DRAFT_674827 [Coprinopsis marcescibilis]|uniref:Uncharacterized protein n=1 Tax=Coprinopsis marcescibilis TaxID=230819 RepID=A0A5C3KGE8_COPMA|nr:hypothetical protein FA15DRAFT_674827 [Coprinopsis marcescibilis]